MFVIGDMLQHRGWLRGLATKIPLCAKVSPMNRAPPFWTITALTKNVSVNDTRIVEFNNEYPCHFEEALADEESDTVQG